VTESKTMTPAVLIAGAVLLASLSAAAGWLISSQTPIATPPAATVAQLAPPAAAKPVADDEVAPPSAPPTAHDAEPKPQSKKPVPVRRPARAATTHSSGTRAAAVCESCGVVASITEVHRKGEANGVGAVAGGVIGGLLGNQIGGGNGKKAMTVVGAVGGGLAGHEIEKRARGDVVYQVHVRMDNGTLRTVTVKEKPADGARVVVEGQSLRVVS
jgi:outer membrane lipoprotein SlyB